MYLTNNKIEILCQIKEEFYQKEDVLCSTPTTCLSVCVYLSVCLSVRVYVSVCLSVRVYLSVCLSLSLSVYICLSVCLIFSKNARHIF
jgi:hypothetical protein